MSLKLKMKNNFNHFIAIALVIFCLVTFILYRYVSLKKTTCIGSSIGSICNLYIFSAVIALFGLILAYYFIMIRNIRIEIIYAVSVFVLSVAYLFIFPPMSVPDEPIHFFSAYRISDFFLLHFKPISIDNIVVRQSEIDTYSHMSTAININNYLNVYNNFDWFCKDSTMVNSAFNFCWGAPVGYIFSGFAIALGRILNLGMFPIFYLGRLANIIAYVLLTYFAIKRVPFGKIVILIFSVLPMTLHLIASFSCDAIINAIAILFFSQILKMMYGTEKINNKDIIICSILSFLLSTCKLVYTPLAFAPFIIKSNRFENKSKKSILIYKLLICALGIVGLIISQLPTILNLLSHKVNANAWCDEPNYSIYFILNSPLQFIKILVDTIVVKGDFYISSLVGGSLGWFQLGMPLWMYLPFIVLLVLSFINTNNDIPCLNLTQKSFVMILCLTSAFLIALSLFLCWTPISFQTIEGIQGRYFLPLIPFIYLVFRNNSIFCKKRFQNYMIFFALFWNVIYGVELFIKAFQ